MGTQAAHAHLAHFIDRDDAGQQLAERVQLRSFERPLVLALPRGGVPVGYEIAKALDAPLDVMLVRKLGAPGFPELAIGAIVDGPQPHRILNERIIEAVQPPPGYIEAEERRQTEALLQRKRLLRRGRPPAPVAGRDVILVDDGVATGSTMRAALKALQGEGTRSITVAVPVGPPGLAEQLGLVPADVDVLLAPEDFRAVGDHYANFAQLTDEEVTALLDQAASRPPKTLLHAEPAQRLDKNAPRPPQ